MPDEIGYILEHSGRATARRRPDAGAPRPGGRAGRRSSAAEARYEELLAAAPDGEPEPRLADGGRHDLDQLHERHDRPAEGRHVHAPRRVPERARRDAPRAARLALGLSLDAADVPLQRLVLHLGRDRRWRDARLPAQARAAGASGGSSTRPASRTCAARRPCWSCSAPTTPRTRSSGRCMVTTAGAPPPPAVIARTEALGFSINHVYGLTETYGPITICEWNPAWDDLDAAERARLKARQGCRWSPPTRCGSSTPRCATCPPTARRWARS